MHAFRLVVKTLTGLILLYLFAATLGAVIPGGIEAIKDSPGETGVLLISGPIHYDFLLPLDANTREHFDFLDKAGHPIPDWAKWLVIGWGAREFYTTTGSYSDVNANAVWRGVFGDHSVMRVEYAGVLNPELDVARLPLNDAQYQNLMHVISNSFRKPIARLNHPGFTSTDMFFEASGRFNIFATCNTWITKALRQAGVPSGIWTPTPYSVRLSLWLH